VISRSSRAFWGPEKNGESSPVRSRFSVAARSSDQVRQHAREGCAKSSGTADAVRFDPDSDPDFDFDRGSRR
jgi:hypothetical protein